MITQEQGHMIADSMKDLTDNGWKILLDQDWKPGVRLVHARHDGMYGNGPHEFRVFYVKDAE